jgi:hypothetical protein
MAIAHKESSFLIGLLDYFERLRTGKNIKV